MLARFGRALGAAAGRVLILAAHLLLRGQLVEHRVEVAGGDADEEPGRPMRAMSSGVLPIRLRDRARP